MVTTLPWRTKPPERVRRIEIKSPVARPGFLFALWKKPRSFTERRAISVALVGTSRFPPQHQGKPTNGRSSSATPATRVQKLLDRTKRRKFSMPRSFSCRGDV
jgi:hypothetical protein